MNWIEFCTISNYLPDSPVNGYLIYIYLSPDFISALHKNITYFCNFLISPAVKVTCDSGAILALFKPLSRISCNDKKNDVTNGWVTNPTHMYHPAFVTVAITVILNISGKIWPLQCAFQHKLSWSFIKQNAFNWVITFLLFLFYVTAMFHLCYSPKIFKNSICK